MQSLPSYITPAKGQHGYNNEAPAKTFNLSRLYRDKPVPGVAQDRLTIADNLPTLAEFTDTLGNTAVYNSVPIARFIYLAGRLAIVFLAETFHTEAGQAFLAHVLPWAGEGQTTQSIYVVPLYRFPDWSYLGFHNSYALRGASTHFTEDGNHKDGGVLIPNPYRDTAATPHLNF